LPAPTRRAQRSNGKKKEQRLNRTGRGLGPPAKKKKDDASEKDENPEDTSAAPPQRLKLHRESTGVGARVQAKRRRPKGTARRIGERRAKGRRTPTAGKTKRQQRGQVSYDLGLQAGGKKKHAKSNSARETTSAGSRRRPYTQAMGFPKLLPSRPRAPREQHRLPMISEEGSRVGTPFPSRARKKRKSD